MKRALHKFCATLAIYLILGTANAQTFKNVVIFSEENGDYPPCEPSIAIDPNNPSKMICGAVLDYVSISVDSGITWKTERLRSKYGVYGDPCVVADTRGRFHYFHLSNPSGEGWQNTDILDRIVCQTIKPGLKRWSKGSSIGHNPPKDQDKEWAAWNPVYQQLVVTWTEFDEYGSSAPGCESRIMLSVFSNIRGWSTPIAISLENGNCIDKSETAEGAVPAIDSQGITHVTWSLNGKIYHTSLDLSDAKNPITVIAPRAVVARDAHWAFSVPGVGRANGMPIIAIDSSPGRHAGAIYVNWADQRNGEHDTDIWIIKSMDGGITWSEPIRVNDDEKGNHQFFTWMTVDQSTGFVYCVFYDRRHHSDTKTDVYLAVSKDGGDTFKNVKISASPFVPPANTFFGDYNGISAVEGVVRPVWTRCDNEKLSIMTAIINDWGF